MWKPDSWQTELPDLSDVYYQQNLLKGKIQPDTTTGEFSTKYRNELEAIYRESLEYDKLPSDGELKSHLRAKQER